MNEHYKYTQFYLRPTFYNFTLPFYYFKANNTNEQNYFSACKKKLVIKSPKHIVHTTKETSFY